MRFSSCSKRKKSMFTRCDLRKFNWYFLSKYHTCVYITSFIKRDARRYRIIHQLKCKKMLAKHSYFFFFLEFWFQVYFDRALSIIPRSDIKSNKCSLKLVFCLQGVKLTSFQVLISKNRFILSLWWIYIVFVRFPVVYEYFRFTVSSCESLFPNVANAACSLKVMKPLIIL